MVTPLDFGAAAGKFAGSYAIRLGRDALNRRRLSSAYDKAASAVRTGYEKRGIHPQDDTFESWRSISRLLNSEECGESFSMGGTLTDGVLKTLQRIYGQESPSLKEILTRMAGAIREEAFETPPQDFKTLEDLLATRLDLILDDLAEILNQQAGESERAEARHSEIMDGFASVQHPSFASPPFVGAPTAHASEIFGRNDLLESMTNI